MYPPHFMYLTHTQTGGASLVGQTVEVSGWVRTVRNQKAFSFVEVNDGSSMSGLQVVVQPECEGYAVVSEGGVGTGASVAVRGEVVASPGGKQAVCGWLCDVWCNEVCVLCLYRLVCIMWNMLFFLCVCVCTHTQLFV